MYLNLSSNLKGLIYLLGGAISLLYINGWFVTSLYYPMLAGSLIAFIYGFIVTDAWVFCKNLINKLTSNTTK
jgi:hypothetical protein